MNEIIRDIRALDVPLLPPATAADISSLEATLGAPLPAELVLLYQDHGGMSPEAAFPIRLMSPAEAIEAHHEFADGAISGFNPQVGAFWTDDNANYAGVFLSGELQGRVCFMDHEEPDDTPRYRNVESFYRHLLGGSHDGLHWSELETDYPVVDPHLDYPEKHEDSRLGQAFLRQASESADRLEARRCAFYALSLLPPAETHLIIPLLRSPDMWVQERTCKVLGTRKYAAATDELYEIARYGTHNGRIAALVALKQIGTPAAREYLERLRVELDPSYEIWLR